MTTVAPRTMTIEEFSTFEDEGPCNLIHGELVRLGDGAQHGMTASSFGVILGEFVRSRQLGAVFTGTTFVLSVAQQSAVRPDIAFLRRDRVPPMPDLVNDVLYAPDIAVEVVSPPT